MNTSNRKIIITGATGLIGKEAIEPLKKAGFEIYALTIDGTRPDPKVNWINANLFNPTDIKKAFESVKPSYLLNFAWATTDDYLTSNINFDFLKAGLDLLKHFKENGGRRAVFAGTCFEYQYKDTPLKEDDPTDPQAIYSKCKNYLRQIAQLFCLQNEISFGWGRIFYVFGLGENNKRLVAHSVNSFMNNKTVVIHNGDLIRAYMFSKDIAAAFAAFLDSKVEGIVNICPDGGIKLGDFAMLIAEKLKKTQFLNILHEPVNQPPIIIGDNTRLKHEVGYTPQYDYESAIDCVLSHCLVSSKEVNGGKI